MGGYPVYTNSMIYAHLSSWSGTVRMNQLLYYEEFPHYGKGTLAKICITLELDVLRNSPLEMFSPHCTSPLFLLPLLAYTANKLEIYQRKYPILYLGKKLEC